MATDPHEEKWNKLTVSSKTDGLKNINVDEKIMDYLHYTRDNITQANSFQNIAFRDLTKHNEHLRKFSNSILRQYEEIQNIKFMRGGIPFVKENALGNYVIDPDQISASLKVAEERVKTLEDEHDLRERDIAKMSGIIELLTEENRYLRDHISFKNKDITKILDTIAINDGEAVHDLRHRLALSTEENNLLLAQLDELKQLKDELEDVNNQNAQALQSCTNENNILKKNLDEALKREEVLTVHKQQNEPKLGMAEQKIRELEAELQDMTEEFHRLKNQNVLTSNQAQNYKKNFEEIDQKKTLEIDKLTQEVFYTQNEKKELKKLIENKEKDIETQQEETRKVRRELETMRLEMEELVQSHNDVKNQLSNEKNTSDTASRKQDDLRKEIIELRNERDDLNKNIKSLKQTHSDEINEFNGQLQQKSNQIEDQVSKKNEALKERDSEIQSLNQNIIDMKKAMQKIRTERDQYLQRLNSQSFTEEDYRQREVENDGLKEENYKLNKQIDELKNQNGTLNKEILQLEQTQQQKPSSSPIKVQNEISQNISTNLVVENPKKRSVAELEKENSYLQNLLKNLMKTDTMQKIDYSKSEILSSTAPILDSKSKTDKDFTSINKSPFKSKHFESLFTSPKPNSSLVPTARINQSAILSGDANHITQGDVDRVIGNILKKYNMEKVPDTVSKPNSLKNSAVGAISIQNQNPPSVRASPAKDSSALLYGTRSPDLNFTSNLTQDRFNQFASPKINFLSPILSTKRDGVAVEINDTTKENTAGTTGLLYQTYNVRDDDIKTLPFQSPDKAVEDKPITQEGN